MKKLLALSVMGVLTLSSFTTNKKEVKKENAVKYTKYTVYFHCSNGASGTFSCYNCGPAQWQSGANTLCNMMNN